MKVKELMENLKKVNPENDVVIEVHHPGCDMLVDSENKMLYPIEGEMEYLHIDNTEIGENRKFIIIKVKSPRYLQEV